jgi:UDP-3-O-[3-hydroxymyristoyl] glucosamine N-acyltransferase
LKHTVKSIADLVEGEIVGNPDLLISKASKIEDADRDSICFISNSKYLHFLETTKAGAVIVNRDFEIDVNGTTLILADDPYVAFTKALIGLFNYADPNEGIHPTAVIEENAQIGKDVYIGPGAYIGSGVRLGDACRIYANSCIYENCEIGSGTSIYANVSVYYGCKIGRDVIIHSGTVIGSDGFGHAPMPNGEYLKIPQIGNVLIGNRVEIGSNCSIDRANMGSTSIGDGCRIDNLIQIAHGVQIGKNTVIAAQAGISGSTKVGEQCIIAGQVGIVGHITIADHVQIGAQSGVSNSIEEPGGKYTDSPHLPLGQAIRSRVIYKNLPELEKRISNLEQQNKPEK